jgi:hypothetical protein
MGFPVQLQRNSADSQGMKFQWQTAVLALAGLLLTGCESGVFDDAAAQVLIESSKLALSGEQVLLTPDQIICGEKKGLWIIDQTDGGNPVGRLEATGRALLFGDDVRMGERKFSNPYVQLRGDFDVKIQKFIKMTDESANVKVAEAKLGVIVKHECFAKPLPLLGIDRGDFSEDAAPRIRLRMRNGWTTDEVLH